MAKIRKLIVIVILSIFLFSLFQLGKVFGDSVPFIISSVEAYASSTDVNYEGLVYDDTNVTNKVTFRNVGDYIKYTITLKNTTNKKYRINLDTVEDENVKEYIQYQYDNCQNILLLPNEEKSLDVYLKYVNDWTDINDRIQIEKFNLVFSYDEEHDPEPEPENTTPQQNIVPDQDVTPSPSSGESSNSGQYSRGRRIRKVTGDYDDTIAPYATLPQTGDSIKLYIVLACVSCILLVFLLRKPSESLTSIEKRYKNKKQKEKLESKEIFGIHVKSMPKLIIRNICIMAILALFIPIVVKAATVQRISFKNTVFLYNKLEVCYVIDGHETTEIIDYNSTITKPNDPEKNGYKFIGWYDENDQEFDFNEPIIEDTVIKAKFELETYTITYVLNGGSVSEGNIPTYTINDEFTLNNPTKTGYEFVGWLKNGATIPVMDMTVSHEHGNITFTAVYNPNHYTVSFNGNGDGVEGSTESQYFTYDVAQELNENGFTRENYVFTGWNTRSNGNGDSYSNKESVKNLATSGTKTLYAQWRELNNYTITFDTVGYGTVSPETKNVKEGKPVGDLPIAQSSREEYKFAGWYTNTDYNVQITPETIIDGNITVVAKWKPKFITVFSAPDEIKFNGTDDIETTDERFNGKKYVDTGVMLFKDQETMNKDFEIGFEIVNYDPDLNIHQATMCSAKYEKQSLNYPGFVFRRNNSTDTLEMTMRSKSSGNGVTYKTNYVDVHKVKIIRKNKIIYYSIDNGNLVKIESCQNFIDRNLYFDTHVIFGSALDDSNEPIRSLVGTLKNMYIKLED